MKKTLFSLAFLAASGGYVAFANHGLDGILPSAAKPEDIAAVPAATALKATIDPVVLEPTPRAPAAIVAPAIPNALATPPLIASTQAIKVPAAFDPPIAAAPPLPRRRPIDAPAIETAQVVAAAPASNGLYRNGTYSGSSENAYYGRVQVQVTVTASQIVSVKVLDYPSDRRTSRYINSQALPMLHQEVMQAQTANVDTVSGATLTSEAYIRSLSSALAKAAGGNA